MSGSRTSICTTRDRVATTAEWIAPDPFARETRAPRSGGARASALVRLAEALEDEPIQIEVEADVLAPRPLARHEAERALAPQQQAVEHAPERLAHRALDLVRSRHSRSHEPGAETLPRLGGAGEHGLERLGRYGAAVDQQLAHPDARSVGAREHGLTALDEDLGALARALELEPPARLGQREQLQDLGGEEVLEVAPQGLPAHCAPHLTSPTTRPPARAVSPVMSLRLYQPSATTWITVAPSNTPSAISVSGSSTSAIRPGKALKQSSSVTSVAITTPVARP